jgi:hypothetical protein
MLPHDRAMWMHSGWVGPERGGRFSSSGPAALLGVTRQAQQRRGEQQTEQ